MDGYTSKSSRRSWWLNVDMALSSCSADSIMQWNHFLSRPVIHQTLKPLKEGSVNDSRDGFWIPTGNKCNAAIGVDAGGL